MDSGMWPAMPEPVRSVVIDNLLTKLSTAGPT